jgi:hypothetical protein
MQPSLELSLMRPNWQVWLAMVAPRAGGPLGQSHIPGPLSRLFPLRDPLSPLPPTDSRGWSWRGVQTAGSVTMVPIYGGFPSVTHHIPRVYHIPLAKYSFTGI